MSSGSVTDWVARMRAGLLSRNRDFDLFERHNGQARRARRLFRFLKALEEDLAALSGREDVTVAVEELADGGRRIVVEVPEVRLRRTTRLSAEEYALLRDDPGARAILDGARRT